MVKYVAMVPTVMKKSDGSGLDKSSSPSPAVSFFLTIPPAFHPIFEGFPTVCLIYVVSSVAFLRFLPLKDGPSLPPVGQTGSLLKILLF